MSQTEGDYSLNPYAPASQRNRGETAMYAFDPNALDDPNMLQVYIHVKIPYIFVAQNV